MSVDTLRGSLDTFALPDIVRLIASSNKTGKLTADSFRMKGRIFLADGAISYATTRGDDGDIEELKRMTTSRALRRERRGRKESSPGQTLEDLIEQQVVEVFVRLMRMQGGKFVFDEGATTRAYGNGPTLALDVDKVIRQAGQRIAEWEDIETVVPSSTTRFSLNRDVGDDEFEVTLDARSWTFLAAIGESASVQDLAERLRIFEFPAAKKVAEFVRRGLLAPAEANADHAPVHVTLPDPARGSETQPDPEGAGGLPAGEGLPAEHAETRDHVEEHVEPLPDGAELEQPAPSPPDGEQWHHGGGEPPPPPSADR